jgi:aminoglycoside phosphotransferase (APT) family kinase protein
MSESTALSRFGEAVAVRPGEDLDWQRLRSYLEAHLGAAEEFSVHQFPNGAANLTYLIHLDDQALVFRRPPFGALAPGAHDMAREFRVLSRLWQSFPRAPRALLFCDDKSVVGSDFLVSEYRTGQMVWSELPASWAHIPDAGHRVGLATVDALADLSTVDPASCGLSDLGRPDGFLRRQVAGWTDRWRRVATDDADEAMTAVAEQLARRLPEPQRVSVLHNDFKIDNCQFRFDDPSTVSAVFDWDMSTLGDPLVDLGILLNYWPDPSDRPDDHALVYPGLELMGLPTRAEVAQRYAARTGLNVETIGWYEAFASWKTATVREQLHHRYLRSESTDPRMGRLHDHVVMLARRALRILTEGLSPSSS